MQEIKIFNWDPSRMCQHKYCSSGLTYFEYVVINGMEIVVSLCKKHAKEWEEGRE